MFELKAGDAVSYVHHWDNVPHVGIVKSADSSCVIVEEDPVGCHDYERMNRRISGDDLFRYHMKVITHEERWTVIRNAAEVSQRFARDITSVLSKYLSSLH